VGSARCVQAGEQTFFTSVGPIQSMWWKLRRRLRTGHTHSANCATIPRTISGSLFRRMSTRARLSYLRSAATEDMVYCLFLVAQVTVSLKQGGGLSTETGDLILPGRPLFAHEAAQTFLRQNDGQFMPDTRWDNPQQIPLSNGPLRLSTPPTVPTVRFAEDGQLIEFLLPFPVHIVDPGQWAALECSVENRTVLIQKPIPVVQPYEPLGRIGNESPDAFCAIVRVACKHDPDVAAYPKPGEVWPLVEGLLGWIRTKARHYWLLHGQAGFGALYRGSLMTQEAPRIAQRNFLSYGRNLIVRPLDEPLWLSIRNELTSGTEIPVSESVLCDALISVVAGDEMKALLELGVAAEIEITQLLVNVSRMPPDTPMKREFITKEGDWDKFAKKLQVWPQELGLQEAALFNPAGISKDWVTVVKELYNFRGSVAHSGKLRAGAAAKNVSAYVFATNALFAYCREQRARAGVADYSYPASRTPYDQIVVLKEGEMYGETSPAVGGLP